MKIIPIKKQYFSQAAKVLYQEFFDSKAKALKEIKETAKSNTCFIAVEKKEVLGVLTYTRHFSHWANYVEYLTVHKDHRRKAIARSLINRFVKVSKKETPKKQKYALSSTHKTNKASQKMHIKLGFKKLGTIKHLHYGKDEIFYGYKLR